MRAFLLALLALAAADAQTPQVDLYQRVGAGFVPVKGALNLGVSAAGGYVEVQLSLRNRGQQTVTLTGAIYASGLGFSVENQAPVGAILAPAGIPGDNLDFRVRFAPPDPGSYTGVLNYLGKPQAELKGSSPESITVQAQRGATGPLETLQTTSAPVSFDKVERKQSTVLQFALVNRTAQALAIRSLSVTGTGYALEGISAPVALPPGATRTFAIRFAPLASGIFRGNLLVDGRQFALEGFALEPAAPILSFDVLPPARSGEQTTVKVRLSEASRAIGSVKITLAGIENDPAVALLPGGGRTAFLALKEGDRELATLIQTGTTAGTLRLTAELGAQRIDTQLVLAPIVPALATVTAARASGRIEVRISGFDNVRAMREAAFQFYDRTGAPIGGLIRSAVTDAFNNYFANSTLGGVFAVTASFPVIGDIDSVTGVEAELTNNQGTARAAKISF